MALRVPSVHRGDRSLKYPAAPKSDLADTLHGVRVPDPFRTLETDDDPATVAWVDAENALTRRLLDGPDRDRFVARLRELHRVPRASVPAVRGERLFFLENDGRRNQAVLYMDRQPLVDPNALDAEGTTAITVFEPDADGDRVVNGLSRHGSDAQELWVHDVARGAALEDRLRWVKFAAIAWWGDGFFYTRYPQPGTVPVEDEQYFCQVWFHTLGDAQDRDRLVYHRPDAPQITFNVHVTADSKYLVITGHRGASDDSEIHLVRLEETVRLKADAKFNAPLALITGFTAGWHIVDGLDDVLYLRTDEDAPFGRIVRFDLNDLTAAPTVVVPESADTLVDAAVANGRLLVSSLRNASSRLESWSLAGAEPREIFLPGIGTIVGLAAQWHSARSFATFTSFTMPPTIMACDETAGRLVAIKLVALPFDPADYATEQVWYPSKDGTPISMFLTRNRSAAVQGCPIFLSGYGGFNISLTPTFDASDFLWLDAGGVMAVANLRGGGEYGDAWHRAGMRERKQNVFDDFIAGAEWLQATGRAAPGRIAIEGGSNGGLLVGACMVQRPELFGAVVCRVPVADMLRYHLFTVGRFWIPEYGCADDANDFEYLIRYSPYHNVVDGVAYPPTLVMTADTDDRVAPGMAKKFAARLQEAVAAIDAGDAGPILLRVETRAGHGAGKPISKQIDEQADLYSFLFRDRTRTSARVQLRP